jgi:hypothetical protein
VGLPSLPIGRIDDLLHARLDDGVEVIALLDKDILPLSAVDPVCGQDRMASASRTAEAVQNRAVRLRCMKDKPRDEVRVLRSQKDTRPVEQGVGLLFTVRVVVEDALADVGFDLVQHAFDTGNLGFIRPPGNAAICIEGFEASLPWVLRITFMRVASIRSWDEERVYP